MEKNIIVTDVNGKVIGSTYPKRAKALVKNGRAEYVGDCEIRLKAAHAPTGDISAEEQMSKIIEFDPRKFGFDKSCRTNEGQRAFMTTSLGNAEVWEIGGHDRHKTQLISKMRLQKYTDYTFRFAMTGGHNENGDEITLVMIFPENRWEERMTYALDKSRFEPVLSKRDKMGLLRVFELPFNSGEAEDWSIVISQERAPARFFAPKENSAYAVLADQTYEQWKSETGRRRGVFGRDTVKDNPFGSFDFSDTIIGGNALKKLLDMAKQGFDVDKIIERAKQGFGDIDSIIEQVKQEIDPDGGLFGGSDRKPDYVDDDREVRYYTSGSNGANFSFASRELDESELADELSKVGRGCNLNFCEVTIHPSADRSCVIIGEPTTGSNIVFDNVTMTAYALSLVMAKVGSGCNVRLSSVTITAEGLEDMIGAGTACSGVNLEMNGVTLPRQALDLIYSRMSGNCNISAQNISTDGYGDEPVSGNAEDPKKSSDGGYYFRDMLKSTFENAAEGLNSFGEIMRKAEEDFTDMVDELVGGKSESPEKPEPPHEEKDEQDITEDGEDE